MIDLKNRTRETLVYQYPRTVSAGPVRPGTQVVYRGEHNPKTGVVARKEIEVTFGGVLTIGPKEEIRNLPDQILNHPTLKRDIAARRVAMTKKAALTKTPSVAKTEPSPKREKMPRKRARSRK